MTLKFSTSVALALSLLLTGMTEAQAQYNWVPYEDNPVIDSRFDATSTFMFRPAVLKKDGIFHMWYGKQVGLPDGSPRSVGYATSEDGIDWRIKKLFAIEPSGNLGSFDQIFATNASVVEDGDTLKMWYNGSGRLASGIGYAWSVDGADWTKEKGSGLGGSVFDRSMDGASVSGVVTPTVIKVDGSFHMWYMKLVNADGKSRIGYARSGDGKNWTVVPGSGTAQSVLDVGDPGTFDANQVWWPWVLYNEEASIFEMWYQGIDDPQFGGLPRLGCARSSDGITWQKIAGDGDAGACRNSGAQPGVILDEGVYRMWYTVFTPTRPFSADVVLYATSVPTATATREDEVPDQSVVFSAYPNPFRSEVTVDFALKTPGAVRLEIHDILGRLVYRQQLGDLSPGPHSAGWNGIRLNGATAPSGAYLIRLVEEGHGLLGTRMVQLAR